jgi:endonuclease G
MSHFPVPAEAVSTQVETGYDPDFLSVGVPMPQAAADRELVRLDYTHFSVLLDPNRRLAAATAVNIDGDLLVDVERGDDWHLDPRVRAGDQVGPEIYRNNDLDRGHLVRRSDPVWGQRAVAERANIDTFAYTNAAPQAAGFNQSKELWLGLEDYLLEHARVFDVRLTVFTGPVFTAADPQYRGIQIPLAFWKVASWVGDDGALSATGYVLDQSAELGGVDLEEALRRAAARGAVPPLGQFRTFQAPILDIEELTGLDFGPAALADRFVQLELVPDEQSRWARLERLSDMAL